MTNKTNLKHRKRRDFWVDIQKQIGKLSAVNQPDAQRVFLQFRDNGGLQLSSIYSYVLALRHADKALQGASFREASPEQCTSIVTYLKNECAPSSAHMFAALLRTYWRAMLEVDELPFKVEKALSCKRPKAKITGQVIVGE